MVEIILKDSATGFLWLDVNDPKKKELAQLASEYGLHPNFVADCLDPEHLPKYEKISDVDFIILRAYDEKASMEADEIQELTRKIAIFRKGSLVVTVHRKLQPFFGVIKNRWHTEPPDGGNQMLRLLAEISEAVIKSYEAPIDRAFLKLDDIEKGILQSNQKNSTVLQSGYFLKRQASVFKRMLKLTADVVTKMTSTVFDSSAAPQVQEIKDQNEALYFYSDQLLDDTNNLLALQISLSSQRTNEVVGVLTLFSVFFLPLNFIASIYGMNFEHMPELKSQYGYPSVLGLMVCVAGGILIWFRRNRWL
jgi:magnesium transporter